MCGICGQLNTDGRPVEEGLLKQMTAVPLGNMEAASRHEGSRGTWLVPVPKTIRPMARVGD